MTKPRPKGRPKSPGPARVRFPNTTVRGETLAYFERQASKSGLGIGQLLDRIAADGFTISPR